MDRRVRVIYIGVPNITAQRRQTDYKMPIGFRPSSLKLVINFAFIAVNAKRCQVYSLVVGTFNKCSENYITVHKTDCILYVLCAVVVYYSCTNNTYFALEISNLFYFIS